METSRRIVDYDLKCCMVGQKCKNNITGRKQRANRPILWGSFGQLKGENILPEKRLSFVRKML
jgi:hypothetical protein